MKSRVTGMNRSGSSELVKDVFRTVHCLTSRSVDTHQLAPMDQCLAQELAMVAQVPIRVVRTIYSLLGNWLAPVGSRQ
jgi:hypothetical protein